MTAIHTRANAASAGLLRIVIFGTWALIPIWEQLPLLAQLPKSSFSFPGPLGFLPDVVLDGFISSTGLWALTIAVIVSCVLVASGLVPKTWFVVGTALLILLHQGIVRGFSGHINHAELAFAYTAVAISVFPLFDGLSLRRPRRAEHRAPEMYRAPFLIGMLVFTISFAFAGAARLSEGVDIFASDTLRMILGRTFVADSAFADGGQSVTSPPWYLASELAVTVQLSYVAVTFAELLSPLALPWRWTRLAFVAFAIVFHLINLIAMGVTFYENLVLLLVFSEVWFHQAAGWLDRVGSSSEAQPLSQST